MTKTMLYSNIVIIAALLAFGIHFAIAEGTGQWLHNRGVPFQMVWLSYCSFDNFCVYNCRAGITKQLF